MKEMTIAARIESIPTVTAFVEEQLEKLDCSRKAQIQIAVAVDEIFSNIARYAYGPEGGEVTVRVETEKDPAAVVIAFIDHGRPFDPLAKPDPDLMLGPEERNIGGLGIYLVKKTMDDVHYEYSGGQNILTIRKQIS
ncbi:MAG: ATP-binding protein [Solobacterium sp.]|nr:ATP-binding protein [Solobacterium sp.]